MDFAPAHARNNLRGRERVSGKRRPGKELDGLREILLGGRGLFFDRQLLGDLEAVQRRYDFVHDPDQRMR